MVNKTWRGRVLATATMLAFGVGFAIGVGAAYVGPVAEAPAARAQSESLASVERSPLIEPAAARPLAGRSASPPIKAQLSAGQDWEPLLAPPTVIAATKPAERLAMRGLSTEAALGEEGRPAKGALARRPWTTDRVTVSRGDTLMDILDRAEIGRRQAHAAIQSLSKIYDPRRLKAGQQLRITAGHEARDGQEEQDKAGPRQLLSMALDLDLEHQILVTRGTDGRYATSKVERPQRRDMVRVAGVINDSLYLAAQRADLPQDVLLRVIKLFSWDVDFQRSVQRGDQFETLFERITLEQSGATKPGELLYTGLDLSGRALSAYRFARDDGTVEYFDRKGRSVRKFLLRTPVDGARLSSRFGMRKHPVLGYSRMHKGTDFAAPRGTPIYAAGSGRVAAAGPNGGYGKYIRVRHTDEYSTAYAHLTRFAKGIKRGRQVRQGQVIGYVGSTGRSTGPHLHYEVLRNGTQVNPLKVKQAPSAKLTKAELQRFETEVARIDGLRTDLARSPQVASTATH